LAFRAISRQPVEFFVGKDLLDDPLFGVSGENSESNQVTPKQRLDSIKHSNQLVFTDPTLNVQCYDNFFGDFHQCGAIFTDFRQFSPILTNFWRFSATFCDKNLHIW
jgi:hypothetical protein